ncbi:TetR family transcriptional regulator [Angustibacter speluncae]
MTPPARRGPRPDVDTRAGILAAAREEFSANGFDGASVRAVARAAEVDPALVRHYFGSKESLFAASLELPVDPTSVLARVLQGDPDEAGERLVHAFCELWDPPAHRERLVAVLRTLVGGGQVAAPVPAFIAGHVVRPLAAAAGSSDPARAAALVLSQVAGMALLRYVVELEPVASAEVDVLAGWYGPTLQRYLTT